MNVKLKNKEIVILKPSVCGGISNDWTLVYNPAGLVSLRGARRYLADWLIRFVPVVKKRMTVYQWLKLIENELNSYFVVNVKEIGEILTMEIVHSKIAEGHVNIVFTIPADIYTTEGYTGRRNSPIVLYSPIPMKFSMGDTTGFPDFINPIERLYDCLQEAEKSSEDFKITV